MQRNLDGFGNFGDFASKHGVQLERFLGADLYVTFKGSYEGKPAVAKFFYEASDANNEFEVLAYLSKAKPGFRTPAPFLAATVEAEDFAYKGTVYEGVYRMIVYEFIEGTALEGRTIKTSEHPGCRESLKRQLGALHALGLVYAGLRPENVVLTPAGEYLLIDYGRAFSQGLQPFPPMQFMQEAVESYGETLPTQEEDFATLEGMMVD